MPREFTNVTSLVRDPIFFGKGDVFVGTRLEYRGRKAPGQIWEVSGIYTYIPKKEGYERVDGVRTLQDLVFFTSGSEERAATFGYLSYSAIWRIQT